MKSITASDLSDRAELQVKVETPDDRGGRAVDWKTERHLWCRFVPVSGVQALEAMRRQSSVMHEVYARYDETLEPTTLPQKRLLFRGEPYNIAHARLEGSRREVVHMFVTGGVAT